MFVHITHYFKQKVLVQYKGRSRSDSCLNLEGGLSSRFCYPMAVPNPKSGLVSSKHLPSTTFAARVNWAVILFNRPSICSIDQSVVKLGFFSLLTCHATHVHELINGIHVTLLLLNILGFWYWRNVKNNKGWVLQTRTFHRFHRDL